MSTLAMAALSAGVGMGVLLVVLGIRGKRIVPRLGAIFPSETSSAVATAWFVAAVIIGLMALALTRWIGAGIGLGAIVVGIPWFFGGAKANKLEIERTQAIASWAEMIRDNMAGAAGLEQALMSTADIAPLSIAREVRAFGNRLDGGSLIDALVYLGDELDHPAADLVVVSLVNASRMESRDLGPLLTRLSDSIRGDVRMRQRVEVGRSRIRISAKIVLGVTLFTVGLLYFTSGDLLVVYDSFEGQLWLLGIFGLFFASLWMMNYYANVSLPERFSARRNRAEQRGDEFTESPAPLTAGARSTAGAR